jgi:hypothetical protein
MFVYPPVTYICALYECCIMIFRTENETIHDLISLLQESKIKNAKKFHSKSWSSYLSASLP